MLTFVAKSGPNPILPIIMTAVAGAAAFWGAPMIWDELTGFWRLLVALSAGAITLASANIALYDQRVVTVTNRSIVSLVGHRINGTPTAVRAVLPRTAQLGPARGIFAKTHLAGERLWVPLRWRALLDVSDRGRPRHKQESYPEPEEAQQAGDMEDDTADGTAADTTVEPVEPDSVTASAVDLDLTAEERKLAEPDPEPDATVTAAETEDSSPSR